MAKLAHLFNQADADMKRNNIADWARCFDKNLVRGVVIDLFRQYEPPKEARKQAAQEIVSDFQYAGDIADATSTHCLGQRTHQNFEQFFPRFSRT